MKALKRLSGTENPLHLFIPPKSLFQTHPITDSRAVLPSRIITLGLNSLISSLIIGKHAVICWDFGVAFFSGLQFTLFIFLQSLSKSIFKLRSAFLSFCPALPINCVLYSSSSFPGASPTIRIFFLHSPVPFILGDLHL